TNGQTGTQRKADSESKDRPMQSDAGFDRNVVARQLRSRRNNPGREKQTKPSREQTEEGAFENQEAHQAGAGCAEGGAQGDLAAACGETNEQQIGDGAAGEKQNCGDGRKQGEEGGAQVAGHVFGG